MELLFHAGIEVSININKRDPSTHSISAYIIQHPCVCKVFIGKNVIYPVFIRGSYSCLVQYNPDSKVHGTNKGPIWGRQDPGGPHVGSINFAIWISISTPSDDDRLIRILVPHEIFCSIQYYVWSPVPQNIGMWLTGDQNWLLFKPQGPILQTRFNSNPSMNK